MTSNLVFGSIRILYSNGVEVQALVTAQVFHEGWHVKCVESIGLVHVEVLPRSSEILIHIFLGSVLIHFLEFLKNFFRGDLSPFLINEEVARWTTLIVLLLESVFLEDVMHKLVR